MERGEAPGIDDGAGLALDRAAFKLRLGLRSSSRTLTYARAPMSPSSRQRAWLRALHWMIAAGTVVSLLPLGVFARAGGGQMLAPMLLAHVPTFLVLLGLSVRSARRARLGEPASRLAVGAFLGALLGSMAVMLGVPALAAAFNDPWALMLYVWTWLALPAAALVGAGLGAGVLWLVHRVVGRGLPAG